MTPERAAEAVQAILEQRPGLVAAYMFGSASRNARHPRDLDIAVMFSDGSDSFRDALALQVELESQIDFPVDVHDFEALPVDFQFRVVTEGTVLVDRNHGARLRRHVKAQMQYYDFKPYLDRIQAGALRRMAAHADG